MYSRATCHTVDGCDVATGYRHWIQEQPRPAEVHKAGHKAPHEKKAFGRLEMAGRNQGDQAEQEPAWSARQQAHSSGGDIV